MTKEQEEAISRLRKITNRQILYGNKYGIVIEEFKKLQEDIETVLNLLKQKDAEIEKKDKMIDLIIDFFYKLTQESPGTTIHYLEKNGFDTSKCNNCSPGNDCRKCFKQYFERKAKDGRL
jgi:hypothetical protein